MTDTTSSERLAALEAKLDIFYSLLTEIRDDLKSHPSKDDYDDLKVRIKDLEDGQLKVIVKLATGMGLLTILTSVAVRYLLTI